MDSGSNALIPGDDAAVADGVLDLLLAEFITRVEPLGVRVARVPTAAEAGGLIALWQGSVGIMAWVAVLSALFFLYCQARILSDAKGIPAWSAPALVPLLLASGLAEGFGLAALVAPLAGGAMPRLAGFLLAALALRHLTWHRYRNSLATVGAPTESRKVLDELHGNFIVSGHGLPLVLLVLVPTGVFICLFVVESIIARIWGREAADDFLANAMTLLGAAALLALTGLLLYGLFSAARWLLRLRKP